jgi:hypothetical protein
MVDHGELDAVAGNIDCFQKPAERLPVSDGVGLFATRSCPGFILK